MGSAGRPGIDRGDPGGPRLRHQLDRHRGGLRPGPFGEDGRAGARRRAGTPVRVHEVQHGLEHSPGDRPQPPGRLHPAGVRGQPAAAQGRCHRPVPDPLARPRRRHRGRVDGHGRAEGGRKGPPHRRVQFQRRADAAGAGDRPHHVAPAAVLARPPGDRARDPSVRRSGRYRRDRLFADGVRPSDGRHDPRTNRRLARGRLAEGAMATSASRSSRATSNL